MVVTPTLPVRLNAPVNVPVVSTWKVEPAAHVEVAPEL
jgi:hypothetical protein